MDFEVSIGYSKEFIYPNIKFELNNSGIINIVGDNGSGKSTFFKTLLGLIPTIAGEVNSEFINNSYIISDYITIPEELKINQLLKYLNINNIDDQELLDYFLEKKHLKFKQLSSGQKRLFEILCMLSMNKKILFLDESVNALDYSNKALVLDYIKKLSKQDILIFNIMHDFDDIAEIGGKIYYLNKNNHNIYNFDDVEQLKVYVRKGAQGYDEKITNTIRI